MFCARMSSRARSLRRGNRLRNTAAPAMHTKAPVATVKGAPSLSARIPARSDPNGAMPINIIEYVAITRPRSSSGDIDWIRVFDEAV